MMSHLLLLSSCCQAIWEHSVSPAGSCYWVGWWTMKICSGTQLTLCFWCSIAPKKLVSKATMVTLMGSWRPEVPIHSRDGFKPTVGSSNHFLLMTRYLRTFSDWSWNENAPPLLSSLLWKWWCHHVTPPLLSPRPFCSVGGRVTDSVVKANPLSSQSSMLSHAIVVIHGKLLLV